MPSVSTKKSLTVGAGPAIGEARQRRRDLHLLWVKIILMNHQEIINKIDFSKLKWNDIGLVPAIVQDYKDNEILMVAFMNKESLGLTLEKKETYFYSRSRNELWHKGHKSGEVQKVKELYYDCDNDTILVKVEQIGGAACHTGKRSCFFNKVI